MSPLRGVSLLLFSIALSTVTTVTSFSTNAQFRRPQLSLRRPPQHAKLHALKDDLSSAAADVTDRVANTDYSVLLSRVASNLGDGSGEDRGEIFVVGQFSLLLLVLCGGIPFVDGSGGALLAVGSISSLLASLFFIIGGALQLGPNLTPFPKPTSDNQLRTDGVYKLVRHPIYGGLLFFCFGVAGITNSAPRFFLSLTLLLVLDSKVRAEEAWLRGKHGAAYDAYVEAVPAALVPLLVDPKKV